MPHSGRVEKHQTLFHWCYTETAEYAQPHPGSQTAINPAEDDCQKQSKSNETAGATLHCEATTT